MDSGVIPEERSLLCVCLFVFYIVGKYYCHCDFYKNLFGDVPYELYPFMIVVFLLNGAAQCACPCERDDVNREMMSHRKQVPVKRRHSIF